MSHKFAGAICIAVENQLAEKRVEALCCIVDCKQKGCPFKLNTCQRLSFLPSQESFQMHDCRYDVSIAHPYNEQSLSSSGLPNFSWLIPALIDALGCKHKKQRYGFLLCAPDRSETGPSVNNWSGLAHLHKLLSVTCAVLGISCAPAQAENNSHAHTITMNQYYVSEN